MPIRKHKRYSRPKKLFDAALIKSENNLIKKYGLKTRREVWKADFAIGKIRNIAKTLITADDKKKEEFVKRQAAKGFTVSSIADVLALGKEDYLKRRLQSLLVAKQLARTHKQARQLITHRHVKLNGTKIDSRYTYIEATGYFGGAKRKLKISIDRATGSMLTPYDFLLYSNENQ